jgi:hypothetical protein
MARQLGVIFGKKQSMIGSESQLRHSNTGDSHQNHTDYNDRPGTTDHPIDVSGYHQSLLLITNDLQPPTDLE